jgi:NADPH-dependent 2,4-dienoyl-CoA reductase/sulfur reductase-like enzyme
MKIVIIGGVAAGTSAAAKARRNAPDAQITVYERDADISYVGCALPYYIGGLVKDKAKLAPRDSAFFKRKYGVDILTRHEVLGIDRKNKALTVKDLNTGKTFEDKYDKLVIATGASPFVPEIPGIDQNHVFVLRSVQNAVAIREFIDTRNPKTAVIIGSGSIGLEMLENLPGIDISVVEAAAQIAPAFDSDMADVLEEALRSKGVRFYTARRVERISQAGVTLNGGETLDAELVIVAAGVRPNTELAKQAGLELGAKSSIRVDKHMRTSDEYIYACGDCAETFSAITGQGAYYPLGSTANKMGRVAGDTLTGGGLEYRGSLGTGVFKVLDMAAGLTGLTERTAREMGYDVVTVRHQNVDRFEEFGGKLLTIKAVADRKTRRLLGAQVIGYGGVDKRLDVYAAMIMKKAAADELEDLDLAYAPPFAIARDAVHYTGMLLVAALDRRG